MSESFDTQQLARLAKEKVNCLTQLLGVGRRQLQLIELNDMQELLKILALKQRLLDGLGRIERALDPFRGQSPEERRWTSSLDREKCAEQMRRCEQLLAEITAQENQSEASLKHRRDEASARIQGTHVTARVHGAYVEHAGANDSRLDVSSES